MNRIAAFVAVVMAACSGRRRQPSLRVPARASGSLDKAERLAILGRVAARIAHEINNPLTGIVGAAELLRDSPELAGCDGVQDDLLRIVKAARRCEEAVRDLVSISFGNVKEAGRVDVSEVAADAVAAESRTCEDAGVSLVVETTDGPLPAFAARGALPRGLRAMISNARQAIAEERRKGRISVRAFAAAGVVRIEVKDDGPGIPASLRESLFEPFASGKAPSQGLGLELAIFRHALKRYDGKIRGGNRPGGGARFVVELPAPVGGSGKPSLAVAVEGLSA